MIVSPGSIRAPRSSIVLSVISPAGTITQTARGAASLATKSASELDPVAPSVSSALDGVGVDVVDDAARGRRASGGGRGSPPSGRARPCRAASGFCHVVLGCLLCSTAVARAAARRDGRGPGGPPPAAPTNPGGRKRGRRRPQARHQRLQDPPGLLDGVLPGEQRMVASKRVMDEPLVGLGGLAELGGEAQIEVHVPAAAAVRPLDSSSIRSPASGSIRRISSFGCGCSGSSRKASRGGRLKITRTSVGLGGERLARPG